MDTELTTLVEFLQTRSVPDVLSTPDGLADWLRQHRLIAEGDVATTDAVRRAVRLRSALISVVRDGPGASQDPRTQPAIDAVISPATYRVTIAADGTLRLEPTGSGIDRALAEILAIAYRAELRGDMARVKLCRGCDYTFYDATRNRSKVWCEMALCGSVEKSRAYRKRVRERQP